MEGSGYFLVNSSEGGIVNMKYREAESAIEVIVVEMLCAREAWVENFKGRFILWKKEEITFFFFFSPFLSSVSVIVVLGAGYIYSVFVSQATSS